MDWGNLIAGGFPGRYGNGVCRGIFVRGHPVGRFSLRWSAIGGGVF
jgi:hypothetical protein